MEIDEEVYSDLGMEGALEQMEKRYRKNKETFVVLENAESGETAGYINFFPVNEETFHDIMCGSEQKKLATTLFKIKIFASFTK